MSLIKPLEMTEAGLAARRANAQQSRGPATPQGKANSAASNLRHGFYSEQHVEAMAYLGEIPSEFLDLMASLHEDLDPRGGLERELVTCIGRTLWRMRRAERMREGLAMKRIERQTEIEKMIAAPGADQAGDFVRPFRELEAALARPDGPTPEEVKLFVKSRGQIEAEGMPEFVKLLESLPALGEHRVRRKALRKARAELDELMRPYMAKAVRLARQFERITSPANLAAMTAPHNTQSLLMQRMEDSNIRQLWRLTQALTALRQGALNQKNIKNEDRSEDVIENTES